MHEVPGITPEVARFARIVRDRGFTVFLPEMFGTVDKPVSGGYEHLFDASLLYLA